jgi:ATPase inhibitor, mitochondrial
MIPSSSGYAAKRTLFLVLFFQEQEQLASLRAQSEAKTDSEQAKSSSGIPREDRDYEAGFGGQEDLEDRYATTSGEH